MPTRSICPPVTPGAAARRRVGPVVGLALVVLAASALAVPHPARAATLAVLNTGDAGAGSLRAALAAASSGDEITFSIASGSVITLTSGPLIPGVDVTITGGGQVLDGGGVQGILVVPAGRTVAISGLTLQHGLHNPGGAIDSAGTLSLRDMVFTDNATANTATASEGGAINSSGSLSVVDSTFSRNAARVWVPLAMGEGGAINAAGTTTISGSTFSSNEAYIAGDVDASGPLTVENSTFSGSTGTHAGSIHALDVSLASVTIAGAVTHGAAVLLNGNATLVNTSISGTTWLDPDVVAYDCSISSPYFSSGSDGTIVSDSHNLIGDGSCDTGSPTRLSGDPLLGTLADNGGTTLTMLPAAGSPLVNAGDNAACPALDQRGATRTRAALNPCDIGAVDLGGPSPLATTTTATVSRTAISSGAAISDTATVRAISITAPQRDAPVADPTGTVTFTYCHDTLAAPVSCTSGTQIGDPVAVGPAAGDGSVSAVLAGWVPPAGFGYYLLHAVYSGDDVYASSADDGTGQLVAVVVGRVPMLQVDASGIAASGSVRACVVFFGPGTDVVFSFAGTAVSATVTADGDGSACATLTLPENATGALDVVVTGTDEVDRPVELTHTVYPLPATDALAPPAAPGPAGGGPASAPLASLLGLAALATAARTIRRRAADRDPGPARS